MAEDAAPGTAVAVYVVRNDGPSQIAMSADKPAYTLAADLGLTLSRLDVTALGIARRVDLDLDPVPMIRSTVAIPSSC